MLGSEFLSLKRTNEGPSRCARSLCFWDGIGGGKGVGESRWGEEMLETRHKKRVDFEIRMFLHVGFVHVDKMC